MDGYPKEPNEAMVEMLAKLSERPIRLYVVATGAGAGIQQEIWRTVPNCSFILCGASFPYSKPEGVFFAGLMPEKFASEEFAIDLACAAYQRAMDTPGTEPVALAVSASVASVKEHRGDHRAHIVCMTRDRIVGRTIILPKGSGPTARETDGADVDRAALVVLLAALNQESEFLNGFCDDFEEKARARFFENPVFLPADNAGRTRIPADVAKIGVLFPGAFDPIHAGHESIAASVEKKSVGELAFAICADAPHKPSLSVQEMLRRAKTMPRQTVLFTRGDPLYIDKARAYPGTPLVIGADALIRMLDPKWGTDPKVMFEEFYRLNTQFYVFGREIDGVFVSAREAITRITSMPDTPWCWSNMFVTVDGRWDVSSTTIRSEHHDTPVKEVSHA